MHFSIYRYDPDKDSKPYMQDYELQLEPSDRMLLDALIRIKAQDDSLSLRRSCREGVCGSDAMNINGKNGLACITRLSELKEPVELRPLPGLPVIRDLIVDMSQFFKQYHSVQAVPGQRRAAAGEGAAAAPGGARRAGRAVRVHPVRLLLDLLSVVLVESRTSSSGRPACCRPIASSPTRRDQATSERLDNLEDPYRLFRCHSIMNCVDVCPKGLNPTRAIGRIKELLVRRAVWSVTSASDWC